MTDWSDLMTGQMDVLRPGGEVDELGSRIQVPEPVASAVPCRVVTSKARGYEQGRDREVGIRTVYVDAPLDVRPGDIVVIDGISYTVQTGADDPSGENEVLEFTVRRS